MTMDDNENKDETNQKLNKYCSFNKNELYPLGRERVRILRPCEYKTLYNAIPKKDYKTSLNALLLTGMRYVELQRFQEHTKWFDGAFIHLPEEAVLKHERRQLERDVRLNPLGRNVVSYFIDMDMKLPCWQTWRDNLNRWAKNAGLSIDKSHPFSVKTTRKTWESWLLATYPERITEITLSQGHTSITSIKHYLNISFTDQDKSEMQEYVSGWL